MNISIDRSAPNERRPLFQRRSLRTRLLVTSISLVMVPVLLIGIIATLISVQGLRAESFDQLESVATLKGNQIQTWLASLQTNLNLVFADQNSLNAISLLLAAPSSEETDPARIRRDLAEYNLRSGYFTEIFIMDLDGRVAISTDEAQEGKIFATQTFFHNGIDGPTFTPPSYELSLKNYSIVVSQPLKNQAGRTIGVLAGRVNLNTLTEIMSQRGGLGETGETYVVNSNNAVLTDLRFQETVIGQTYINTEGVVNVLAQQANGSGIYEDYRGVSVVGVYHWVPDLQIAVIAEQDESEALASVNRLVQVTIGLTFITVFLAVLAAYLITQSITIPIIKLADAAGEISKGNLDQNVEISQQDEIGTLANSFNLMTSRLRDLVSTLEQRVQQRTQALNTSAEVSRRLSSVLDEKQLFFEVVEQVKNAYNYYHGQIYLLDETGQTLVLAGATGEGGRQMLENKHSVSIERGLVGLCARTKSPVLVPDTSKEPTWLPNPLLPETKAEIVIPILQGEQLLGVIDMQDSIVGDIYTEDIEFLQSIANQVTIALLNIRASEATRVAQEQYALAVEGSNDGIWDWNIETNKVYYSPRWKEMIGYREDELNNGFADFEALLHPEDHAQTLNAVGDYLSGKTKEYDIQFRFRHKDGSYRWIQAKGKAMRREDGTPYRMAGSHTDITERKRQEDINIQRARQQEAINTITQRLQSTATVEEALQVTARELGHALGRKQTLVKLESPSLNRELESNT